MKRIKNAPTAPETTQSPSKLNVQLEAKIKNQTVGEGELKRQQVLAYAGNPVDLWDYGFDEPVVYNLATGRMPDKVAFLSGHYSRTPLGHVENISKDESSIRGEAVYSYPSQESKEVAAAVENGLPYQASIGLSIPENSGGKITYHADGEVVVNGQTLQAPLYVVDNWVLNEVSSTLFGRDSDTSITKLSKEALMRIKNQKPANKVDGDPTPEETNEAPPTETVENNKDVDKTSIKNQTPPKDSPTPPADPPKNHSLSVSQGAMYRLSRFAKDDKEHEIIENGLDQGHDEQHIKDAISLHRYNNSQANPPSPGNNRDGGKVQRDHFLARAALSFGIDPEFLEKKMGKEVAGRAFDNGAFSLKEMITLAANANGGNFTGHSDIEGACSHLKQLKNNQQWSTINFPNLLHTITQFSMDQFWEIGEPWVTNKLLVQNQSNFKPTGRIRPSGGQMWDELDQDGRIQHGSVGEEKTYQTDLKTIAQMLTFKRTDIVNDDLGVLQESLALMVEGATMVPDFMFTRKLYEGRTTGFLSAGKSNVLVGSGALAEATLRTAYNAVRQHEIKKGNKDVKTTFNTRWMLVVSKDLEETAWELIRQERIVSNTTSNTKQGAKNYWFGRLELEVFDQLDNATYHADADSANWMIMPVRKALSPYSLTYLNNRRAPTTETVDLDADMLGFGVRGYWDVNVNEREDQTIYLALPNAS